MIKVFGCSHSGIFKKIKLKKYTINSDIISGASLSGLPKRVSTLNIKNRIIFYLKKKKTDFLVLKFGQVDIDLKYYYKLVVKGENIDKKKYIKDLILCYKEFISEIKKYIDKKKIIIFGINPPSLIDKESCYIYTSRIIFNKSKNSYSLLKKKIETIEERTAFSKLFNSELKEFCKKENIKYTEVFNEVLNSNKIVSNFFTDNNDHHLKGITINQKNFEPITQLFKKKLESIISKS